MAVYNLSDGTTIKKSILDRRIEKAKKEYSNNFIEEHQYVFCERCNKNTSGCSGIARSHIISVMECQNSGRSELAYDQDNLELLGQECHKELETWSHQKREHWYKKRKKGWGFDWFIIDHIILTRQD